MKKIVYFISLTAFIASCTSEPHYMITGEIEGADSITFLLQKREAGKILVIDSAVADKGSFKMKGGSVLYPEMVFLSARGTGIRTAFYLENSKIKITGKLDSLFDARISGSKTQDEYKGLIDSGSELNEKYVKIYNDYQTANMEGNKTRMTELEKEAEAVQSEVVDLQKSFIKNNPASFVSPLILRSLSYEMDPGEIESYIDSMDKAVVNTPIIKELKEKVEIMKKVEVGQRAPDFTLNDPEGNPVSLYSRLGSKVLLLDFWASWCVPCRQENPHLVSVFSEFKECGFDVFSVSLDQSKDAWIKAIADDKLTWTHVSDLQYWNNAAAKLFAVNAIPSNFLLDENGVIIARNLRGEALYNKVKEIVAGI